MKSKVTFKVIRDDDFESKWISPRLNNGDWDYWLVISVVDLVEAAGSEAEVKYQVCISAVSPAAAGEAHVKSAFDSMGITEEVTDEMKAEALSDYGVEATLKGLCGNNKRALVKQMRDEAQTIQVMFGFYMDAPANQIGHTGWDFIRGDLSLETAVKNRKEFATA
jgi:hypothetical protein